MEMTDKAREARNAYYREHYRKNRERYQEAQKRYWTKRAEREKKQDEAREPEPVKE